MKKIEIFNNTREYEIADKVYKITMTDRKTREVYKALMSLQDATSAKEVEELKDKVKDVLDEMFFEGAGQEIYEVTGSSTPILISVMAQISEDLLAEFQTDKIMRLDKLVNG